MIVLEITVAAVWIVAVYVWQRRRVRRIREEGERDRRSVHEIFEDLKHCVEQCHE